VAWRPPSPIGCPGCCLRAGRIQKRRQAQPLLKVTRARAFGSGWRMPIRRAGHPERLPQTRTAARLPRQHGIFHANPAIGLMTRHLGQLLRLQWKKNPKKAPPPPIRTKKKPPNTAAPMRGGIGGSHPRSSGMTQRVALTPDGVSELVSERSGSACSELEPAPAPEFKRRRDAAVGARLVSCEEAWAAHPRGQGLYGTAGRQEVQGFLRRDRGPVHLSALAAYPDVGRGPLARRRQPQGWPTETVQLDQRNLPCWRR